MTTVLLAVLLSFLSFKLIHRGVKTYQTETRELAADVSNEHPGASGGGGGDARTVTDGLPRIAGAADRALVDGRAVELRSCYTPSSVPYLLA